MCCNPGHTMCWEDGGPRRSSRSVQGSKLYEDQITQVQLQRSVTVCLLAV